MTTQKFLLEDLLRFLKARVPISSFKVKYCIYFSIIFIIRNPYKSLSFSTDIKLNTQILELAKSEEFASIELVSDVLVLFMAQDMKIEERVGSTDGSTDPSSAGRSSRRPLASGGTAPAAAGVRAATPRT